MKIGIIVAMQKEFVQLQKLLENATPYKRRDTLGVRGTLGANEIILQQAGMGKVNAAIGATELMLCDKPELLVSTGVAGGADRTMHPLDVIVGTEYRFHDVYCGSEVEKGQMVGLPPAFYTPEEIWKKAPATHRGLIVTGDWFVDSKEKIYSILADFPEAKAVDMESCALAQTAYAFGVPFVSFRIISDVPLNDDKASQYFDFWKKAEARSFESVRQFLQSL